MRGRGCGWPSDGGLDCLPLVLFCRFLPPANDELVVEGERRKRGGEGREKEGEGRRGEGKGRKEEREGN